MSKANGPRRPLIIKCPYCKNQLYGTRAARAHWRHCGMGKAAR